MALSVLLTLLPIAVILLLMLRRNTAADTSGLIGCLITIGIAVFFFSTPPEVTLRAGLAGIISSFPVSLMVAASILQITFMEATGALKRIVVFVKTLSPSDRAVQIMLINVGAGTLLVSIGATPVSILPPILVALGYSTFIAVALPALGFDALCTFALLGAPLVVYSDLTGVSLVEAARVFAKFMPVISTLIGFGMLWLVGRVPLMREGFVPCLIAGLTCGGTAIAMSYIPFVQSGVVLTGVVAGFNTIVAMMLYLKAKGKKIIDRSDLNAQDLAAEKTMSLPLALSPWIILIGSLVVINFHPAIFNVLFNQFSTPVSVIPGQEIKTRLLWNAYTWVVISTLAAALFIRPSARDVQTTLAKWWKRTPKPLLSAAIFFAIAFIMNNSGFQNGGGQWTLTDPHNNMIWVMANASATVFGPLYPFISGFLGLFGGFVSGSEASTIAMFTKYHLIASDILQVNALVVTAATAIGGGLASVISPAKLQNAAATIDALGVENQVLKSAFVISLIMTTVTALMALIFVHI